MYVAYYGKIGARVWSNCVKTNCAMANKSDECGMLRTLPPARKLGNVRCFKEKQRKKKRYESAIGGVRIVTASAFYDASESMIHNADAGARLTAFSPFERKLQDGSVIQTLRTTTAIQSFHIHGNHRSAHTKFSNNGNHVHDTEKQRTTH